MRHRRFVFRRHCRFAPLVVQEKMNTLACGCQFHDQCMQELMLGTGDATWEGIKCPSCGFDEKTLKAREKMLSAGMTDFGADSTAAGSSDGMPVGANAGQVGGHTTETVAATGPGTTAPACDAETGGDAGTDDDVEGEGEGGCGEEEDRENDLDEEPEEEASDAEPEPPQPAAKSKCTAKAKTFLRCCTKH